MRKNAWLLLPAALTSLAILIPVAPSSADENMFGRCPDHYTPTPSLLAQEEDNNNNGVICVKPGPNGVITHDDPNGRPYECNGFPTPPPPCGISTDNLLIGDDLPLEF
jgi:hypothetical protein